MKKPIELKTKFWAIPKFDNLELYRAKAIRCTYSRHSHSGYSIGIIESGVGGNYYQGNTYLAPPKSIVLMNPEEAHTGYSAEELPLSYRMLYPSIDLVRQIASEAKITGTPCFKNAVVQNKFIARKILYLHEVLEKSSNQLKRESLLIEVFLAILSNYADIKTTSIRSNKEHRAIGLVREYLQDNFSSNVSLEQLVKITNLHPSYLIRIFRQSVGMPPHAYLNQIRMRKAKEFLHKGMPITDTAITVGMSDQSHLTRQFKRIYGITPGNYRQMSILFKTNKL